MINGPVVDSVFFFMKEDMCNGYWNGHNNHPSNLRGQIPSLFTWQTYEEKGHASSANWRALAEPHKEKQVQIAPLNYVDAFVNAF